MKCRQTGPKQSLIVDDRLGTRLWQILHRLPPRSGVLLLYRGLSPRQREDIVRRLRRSGKRLRIIDEAKGEAARVHDIRELRRALLVRTPMILLSPIYSTASHPNWSPLPRMRAAALTRLGGRRLIALGGMEERRFRRVQQLGFVGWAGIAAWNDV